MIGMDTSSMVVLLLITFIAWSLGVEWLFAGLLILFLITSGSIAISLVTLLGVAALYLFKLQQYWFVLLFVVIGLMLAMQGRKKEPSAEEYYSPELMQLLGGAE